MMNVIPKEHTSRLDCNQLVFGMCNLGCPFYKNNKQFPTKLWPTREGVYKRDCNVPSSYGRCLMKILSSINIRTT